MFVDPKDLSRAIVVGLGYGTEPAPGYAPERLASEFGAQRAGELQPLVAALLAELAKLPVEWSAHTLESAARWAHTEMQRRHPQLSEAALQALEWKFSYDWR